MKIYLIASFLLMAGWMNAQNLDPTVIATAGGSDENAEIRLDWTLGEIAIATGTPNQKIITEGFQQPNIEVEEHFTDNYNKLAIPTTFSKSKITLFPNPVSTTLNVKLQSSVEEVVQLNLSYLQGGSVIQSFSKNSTDEFEIDMSNLPSGLYLLYGKDGQGNPTQTFKITKH